MTKIIIENAALHLTEKVKAAQASAIAVIADIAKNKLNMAIEKLYAILFVTVQFEVPTVTLIAPLGLVILFLIVTKEAPAP
jgi:hypothetical protein